MLSLKEKELNELEEDAYVSTPKRRIMPSRAGYYANVQEAVIAPVKKEDYTIELIRGGSAVASKVETASDLDIDASNLTEADLRQYEKMSSNLVPSGATMRVLTARQKEEESIDEAVTFKINKKGLIMLLTYAVVIIGIFAAIIINAVSLVSLMNSTNTLEIEISTVDANLKDLNEEVQQALDNDMLYDKAVNELGMINGSSANGIINIPSTVPDQQILQSSTNLYDWALDTGIIGIVAGAVVLLGGGFAIFMFVLRKKKSAN